MADVTFPSVPRVVSLLHYDDIDRNKDLLPVAGYPVICVTVRPEEEAVSDDSVQVRLALMRAGIAGSFFFHFPLHSGL